MSERRTECGRKAFGLVLMRCHNVILYLQAENDLVFIKPEFQNIPISSTGHSTVHRTDGIHSFGENPDYEYYTQNTMSLSTLQLEDDDARQLTDCWRDVNVLGRYWGRSVRWTRWRSVCVWCLESALALCPVRGSFGLVNPGIRPEWVT